MVMAMASDAETKKKRELTAMAAERQGMPPQEYEIAANKAWNSETARRDRERERGDKGGKYGAAMAHENAARLAAATKEYARVRTMNGNPVPRTLGGSANPDKAMSKKYYAVNKAYGEAKKSAAAAKKKK
jgi:hypothetical protein